MLEIDENKEDLRVITEEDLKYLRRSVELAKTALEKNDEPFGSVLVDQNGDVLLRTTTAFLVVIILSILNLL